VHLLHQSDDGECLERGHRRESQLTTRLVYLVAVSTSVDSRHVRGTGNGPGR